MGGHGHAVPGARGGQTIILIVIVVAAIVALFAFMTLPASIAVPDAEKRFACAKNLKQISAAIEMYRVDYDGLFPFPHRAGNTIWDGKGEGKVSIGRLYPAYIKDARALFCPAHRVYRSTAAAYGFHAFGEPGRTCLTGYFVRGAVQFDPATAPDSCIDPDTWPEKVAWISDFNLPGSSATAHKNRGMNVLLSDGSVFFIKGSYSCRTETDLSGDRFWQARDGEFASHRKPPKARTHPPASNTSPETRPQ